MQLAGGAVTLNSSNSNRSTQLGCPAADSIGRSRSAAKGHLGQLQANAKNLFIFWTEMKLCCLAPMHVTEE